jgi:hypothetical protein
MSVALCSHIFQQLYDSEINFEVSLMLALIASPGFPADRRARLSARLRDSHPRYFDRNAIPRPRARLARRRVRIAIDTLFDGERARA